MPIEPRNRAMGYIKGNQGYDLRLSVEPGEHYISAETGRATIPTKTVDLKEIQKWRALLHTPIYMSDVVPVGQVVIVDHGALPYHYGAYLHPTDYYWVKHKDNPELAHNLVMSWIDQRIDAMGKAAEARLDAMVEEMEFKASQKAAYDRYKEQVKYYHDFFGDDLIDIPRPFGDIVAYGEEVHRQAEEEVLRQEHEDDKIDAAIMGVYTYRDFANGGDRLVGYPDDWSRFHPNTVEPKTSSIFDHRNGSI